MPLWLTVSLAALGGALLSGLSVLLWARSRVARERLQTAQNTATLQTQLEAEKDRRISLEAAHAEAQLARTELEKRAAVADRELQSTREHLEEQRGFLDQSKRDFENAFKALAAEALQGNNEQFLALAKERWGKARTEASSDLEERKKAIENLLEPLRDTLGKLETRTSDIEKAREGAYAKIDTQMKALATATATLNDKTTSLTTALKGSTRARGQWGEIALRRVAELAGMTEHCDFNEQVYLPTGARPDMVVHLPQGRKIAVDAKFPLSAYMQGAELTAEEARDAAYQQHAKDLRRHVTQLSTREYADALGSELDMVVLFLPGDPLLAAAFAHDPDLQVDALRNKILLATPTTLVALLRTVAIYWQQLSMAENAERIAETARTLYDRTRVFAEHLTGVGKDLQGAVDNYNKAIRSFESRLLPMGRQLEEMRVVDETSKRIQRPGRIDEPPRQGGKLESPDQGVVPLFDES